jgi:Tfp pilus assembly protein PilO
VHAVGAAVIGAISIVAFLVVVQPVLRMRTQRVEMVRELDEQQRMADDLDQKRQRLEDAMGHIRRQLATSRIQLQSSKYLNARIAHIIDQADKGELDVHETRPGTVRDHPRYQTVPILLAGRGSYSDCAAFLHRLRESLPDTGVVEFELTGRPAAPLAPASFRFNLVWYAGPATAGAP